MNDKHTRTYLRTLIYYDQDTGLFKWRQSGRGRHRGMFAGTPVKRGGRAYEVGNVPDYATKLAKPIKRGGEALVWGKTNDKYIIVDGYRIIIEGENYTAHELAWFLMYGEWTRVYHKDGDKLNNKLDNLTNIKPVVEKKLTFKLDYDKHKKKPTASTARALEDGVTFTPIQEMQAKVDAVKEQVEYNPATGMFRRKLMPKFGWSQGIAIHNGSYAISITIKVPYGNGARKTTVPAHVAAYICQTGAYNENRIVHKDGNVGNNKWENIYE